MQHFFIRASLFFAPLGILLFLSVFALWHFGELTNNADILHMRKEGQHYLMGKQYVPSRTEVKHALMRTYPANVVVLGNSRAFQIRHQFFVSTTTFFNYSQIGSAHDLLDYLSLIENHTLTAPKVLVLILDQRLVLAGTDYNGALIGDGVGEAHWLRVIANVTKDILTGKIPLKTILTALPSEPIQYIGARAAINHAGYRDDGSYSYGDVIPGFEDPRHEDHDFTYTLPRIERSIANFTHASAPSEEVLQQFSLFLTDAQKLGIHVVTVFPPFPPTIYKEMNKPVYDYGYMKKASVILNSFSAQHGHTFYDFTDPHSLTLRDSDFFDGIHWGEVANAKAFMVMVKSDPVLSDVVDKTELEKRLRNNPPRSRYLFGI